MRKIIKKSSVLILLTIITTLLFSSVSLAFQLINSYHASFYIEHRSGNAEGQVNLSVYSSADKVEARIQFQKQTTDSQGRLVWKVLKEEYDYAYKVGSTTLFSYKNMILPSQGKYRVQIFITANGKDGTENITWTSQESIYNPS